MEHHGILGMKWGIRRYQNKDGSLTDAGKERLANKVAKQLMKDKYSWGKDLQNTKSFQMITDLISTDQIQAIEASRNRLDKVLSENKYDGNKIDQEAYSLLEKEKSKYYSQAKEIFAKREGYSASNTDVFQDAFDLAYDDVLKVHLDIKKKEEAISKAVDDHMNLLKQIIDNSLIGDYGHMKIDPKKSYSNEIRLAIIDLVYSLDKNPQFVKSVLKSR